MEYWVSLWKHKKKVKFGMMMMMVPSFVDHKTMETGDKMPSHSLTRVSNHALCSFFFFLSSTYLDVKQFKFGKS